MTEISIASKKTIFVNTFKDPDEPEAAISKNNQKEKYLYDYIVEKQPNADSDGDEHITFDEYTKLYSLNMSSVTDIEGLSYRHRFINAPDSEKFCKELVANRAHARLKDLLLNGVYDGVFYDGVIHYGEIHDNLAKIIDGIVSKSDYLQSIRNSLRLLDFIENRDILGGDKAKTIELIDNCSINYQDENGYTAAHHLVLKSEDPVFLEKLSQAGADFNIMDYYGWNPYQIAKTSVNDYREYTSGWFQSKKILEALEKLAPNCDKTIPFWAPPPPLATFASLAGLPSPSGLEDARVWKQPGAPIHLFADISNDTHSDTTYYIQFSCAGNGLEGHAAVLLFSGDAKETVYDCGTGLYNWNPAQKYAASFGPQSDLVAGDQVYSSKAALDKYRKDLEVYSGLLPREVATGIISESKYTKTIKISKKDYEELRERILQEGQAHRNSFYSLQVFYQTYLGWFDSLRECVPGLGLDLGIYSYEQPPAENNSLPLSSLSRILSAKKKTTLDFDTASMQNIIRSYNFLKFEQVDNSIPPRQVTIPENTDLSIGNIDKYQGDFPLREYKSRPTGRGTVIYDTPRVLFYNNEKYFVKSYTGSIVSGAPDGLGTITFSKNPDSGEIYTFCGQFKAGQINGSGYFSKGEELLEAGSYANGARNGRCLLYKKGKIVSAGLFKNNKQIAEDTSSDEAGTIHFNDYGAVNFQDIVLIKDTYVGELAGGRPNGIGTLYCSMDFETWKERFLRSGDFNSDTFLQKLYDSRNAASYYPFREARNFEVWKKMLKTDKEQFLFMEYLIAAATSPIKYTGEFKDGQITGYGEWSNTSEVFEKGFYKDGLRQGECSLYSNGLVSYVGIFDKGNYADGKFNRFERNKDGDKNSRVWIGERINGKENNVTVQDLPMVYKEVNESNGLQTVLTILGNNGVLTVTDKDGTTLYSVTGPIHSIKKDLWQVGPSWIPANNFGFLFGGYCEITFRDGINLKGYFDGGDFKGTVVVEFANGDTLTGNYDPAKKYIFGNARFTPVGTSDSFAQDVYVDANGAFRYRYMPKGSNAWFDFFALPEKAIEVAIKTIKEATKGIAKIVDLAVDGAEIFVKESWKELSTAAEKIEKEAQRANKKLVNLEKKAIFAVTSPITNNIDELKFIDTVLDRAINMQNVATTMEIALFNPKNVYKVDTYRTAYNGFKVETMKTVRDVVRLHNEIAGEFSEEILGRISGDMEKWMNKYIALTDKAVDYADAIASFESMCMIVMTTVGSYVGGPLGAAAAKLLVEEFIMNKKQSVGDMLKGFAIGVASGYAAQFAAAGTVKNLSSVDMKNYIANMANSVTKQLTEKIGNKYLNGGSFSSQDVIAALLTSAATIDENKLTANALDAVIKKDIVPGILEGKSINFDAMVESAMQGSIDGAVNATIAKEVAAAIPEKYKDLDKALFAKMADMFTGITELTDALASSKESAGTSYSYIAKENFSLLPEKEKNFYLSNPGLLYTLDENPFMTSNPNQYTWEQSLLLTELYYPAAVAAFVPNPSSAASTSSDDYLKQLKQSYVDKMKGNSKYWNDRYSFLNNGDAAGLMDQFFTDIINYKSGNQANISPDNRFFLQEFEDWYNGYCSYNPPKYDNYHTNLYVKDFKSNIDFNIDESVVEVAKKIGHEIGQPYLVVSEARRDISSNIGATNSLHYDGLAIDIHLPPGSSDKYAEIALRCGASAVGVYKWGIHIDTRPLPEGQQPYRFTWKDGVSSGDIPGKPDLYK